MSYYKVIARVTKEKTGQLHSILVKGSDMREIMEKVTTYLAKEFDKFRVEDVTRISFDKEL